MHSLLVAVLLPEVWMSLFITFSFDAFTPLGHFCVHVFIDSLLLVFADIFWYDSSDFYVVVVRVRLISEQKQSFQTCWCIVPA